MRWFVIVEAAGRAGADNMWIDDALRRRAGAEGVAFLRLYRWSPGCLSFGRNEPATTRYDRAAITARGLATVRRPTGGRAVWHDAEATYAVTAPADTFGTLAETYHAIHATIADALRALGASVNLAGRPPRGGALRPGAGACFASPAGGEVVAGGRKLVGSAQVREGAAFLQHGSILLDDGQDLVAALTRGAAARPAATSLRAILGHAVAFDDVAGAFGAAARSAWPGIWSAEAPPDPPAPERNPFADDAWTWRR